MLCSIFIPPGMVSVCLHKYNVSFMRTDFFLLLFTACHPVSLEKNLIHKYQCLFVKLIRNKITLKIWTFLQFCWAYLPVASEFQIFCFKSISYLFYINFLFWNVCFYNIGFSLYFISACVDRDILKRKRILIIIQYKLFPNLNYDIFSDPPCI